MCPAFARARGGIRTHTPLRTMDFESIASAIPPPGRGASVPSERGSVARAERRVGGLLVFVFLVVLLFMELRHQRRRRELEDPDAHHDESGGFDDRRDAVDV